MFLPNFLNDDYELKSKAIILRFYLNLRLLHQKEAHSVSKAIVLCFSLIF